MTRFALVALLVAGMPLTASGQQVNCATAQVQVELTFCAEQDWSAADARLNTAYKTALFAMKDIDRNLGLSDQGAESALRTAQRAWVSFRDNTCDAEGWAMHGGSAEPMVIYGCRARVTADRADELQNMTPGD